MTSSEGLSRPRLVSLAILFLYLLGGIALLPSLISLSTGPYQGQHTCSFFGMGASGGDCDLWSLPASALMFLMAELVRRNVWWSRELLLGLSILLLLPRSRESWSWDIPPALLDPRIVWIALCALAWWYLYRKPNVKAFYAALKRGGSPDPGAPPAEAGSASRTLESEDPSILAAGGDPEPARPRPLSLIVPLLYLLAVALPAVALWVLYYETGRIEFGLLFFSMGWTKTVAGLEALQTSLGVTLLVAALAHSGLAILLAELVRRGVWWTREVMVGLVLFFALRSEWLAGDPASGAFAGQAMNLLNLAVMAALCVLAVWTFYGRPDVAAYYTALKRTQTNPDGSSGFGWPENARSGPS